MEKTEASTLVSNVISLNFEYGYFYNASGGFTFTTDGSWDSTADHFTTYYRNGDPKPGPDGLPHAVKITIVVQDDQKREDPLTLSTIVYLPMSEER